MENLKEITAPVEAEMALFESELKSLINKENNFLKGDLEAFMFNKPKRLRVLFVFLFAKMLEIDSPLVQKIALAVELIHSASLIHDDIIDSAITRRNLTCFHKKYNSKLAVLEGDLLLSMALSELAETSVDILKIFSDKIKDTLNGEITQNSNLEKITTVEAYLNKTFQKTGNLYLAGVLSLFTLKYVDNKTQDDIANFIINYSTAFQIQNDIKNCFDINSDFTNGNYTLAVIYSNKDNNLKPKSNIERKYIDMAVQKRDEFKLKAQEFLRDYPKSIYKDAILKLCDYTLGADFEKPGIHK